MVPLQVAVTFYCVKVFAVLGRIARPKANKETQNPYAKDHARPQSEIVCRTLNHPIAMWLVVILRQPPRSGSDSA